MRVSWGNYASGPHDVWNCFCGLASESSEGKVVPCTSSNTRLGRSGHTPGTGCLRGNAWIKWLPTISLVPSQQQSFWRAGLRPTGFPEAAHRPGDNTCLTAAAPRHFPTAAGAAGGHTRRGGHGEAVPVPRHTPGTKANRSVPAMGRHGLQTRALRGAVWHNSLATQREKQRRCLPSEGPRGDGPPGTAGDRSRAVRCPTCLSPSSSAHTSGSRSRPAATRVAVPEKLLRFRPPRPGALSRGRAQQHHGVAPERRGRQGRVPVPVPIPVPERRPWIRARRKRPKARPSPELFAGRVHLEIWWLWRATGSCCDPKPSLRSMQCSLDSSARCLGWESRGFVVSVLPGCWVESAQGKGLCEKKKDRSAWPGAEGEKWLIWLTLWKCISNYNCRRKGVRDTNWERQHLVSCTCTRGRLSAISGLVKTAAYVCSISSCL